MKSIPLVFASSFAVFFSSIPTISAQVIVDNQQTLNGTTNNIGGQLIYVGYSTPNGRYDITNGGKFSTNSFGYLGYSYNSVGKVNVNGKGSSWTSQSGLYVGYLGNGEFSVLNGASALTNNTFIGGSSSSTGKGLVSGAGTVWTAYDLTVGWANGATGYLNVENSGHFIASLPTSDTSIAALTLGDDINSNGYLTVIGQNATLTVASGDLAVANYGNGELKISDTGIVEVLGGKIEVGKENGSSGHIIIGDTNTAIAAGYLSVNNIDFNNGSGQLTFNHTDNNYVFAPVLTSTGTGTHKINHLAGNTLLSTNSSGFKGNSYVSGGEMIITNTGKLGGSLAQVTGGSFIVDGQYLGAVNAQTGGIVTGSGTIDQDVTITDGILKGTAGNQLTIGGDLVLNSNSQTNVELGAPSTSALFNIAGNLTLDGKINVSNLGGFSVGIYRIMDYQGTLTDQILDVGSQPANFNLSVDTATNNQVNLVVDSTDGGSLIYWNGTQTTAHPGLKGGDGNWTNTNDNWTNADGSEANSFRQGNYAEFAGQSGTVSIVDNPDISGMQFLTDGYTIQSGTILMEESTTGSGVTVINVDSVTGKDSNITAMIASELAGTTTLLKGMAGTLILTGNNSYTGGTLINDGTLQISSDTNLGVGDLTFNGNSQTKETLKVSADITTHRNINLSSTSFGRISVDNGVTYQVDGNMTGNGQLVKEGAGRLELTSTANNYRRTWIDEGTLAGSSQTIKGQIIFSDSPDAIVELNETANNTLSNAIAGFVDGKVVRQGTVVKKGSGELTYDGLSLVDWRVEEGKVITATNKFRGNVDLSAGTEFHFNQSYDGTYAGQFSGSGDLVINDTGALSFSGDSSAFVGNTTIQTGTLLINKNAALGGVVTAQTGATLGGNGRVGNAVITNGGIISPGENGIGTLTVDNNLTMAKGSIYDVEVKSDLTSDLINVGGQVDIQGGTVNVLAENGNWNLKSKVTIIHAANQAITGQFDNLTTNLAFLTPYLDYSDPNRVILSLLRNNTKFEAVGSTYNQRGVGAGLSSLPNNHPVLDAVIGMTGDQAKAAYDNLSGEIYASTKSALMINSRYLRDAINNHLLTEKQPTDQPIWFSTWGHNNNIQGDNNARGINNDGWGVTFGLDKTINDHLLAGVTLGYESTHVNANGSRGKSDVDAYHLGTYLATEVSGIKLRGGLTYSYLDINTERKLWVEGLAGKAKDNYNGWQLQAFTEANYDFAINKNMILSPYINLAHVWLNLDKAREHDSLAALEVNNSRDNVTFSTLGVRNQIKLNTKIPISLYSDLGWQYAYGNLKGKNHHRFLGVGNSFAIKGVGVNRNSAIVGAGINAEITKNSSIRLGYQGQLSNNFEDHSANLMWTLKF